MSTSMKTAQASQKAAPAAKNNNSKVFTSGPLTVKGSLSQWEIALYNHQDFGFSYSVRESYQQTVTLQTNTDSAYFVSTNIMAQDAVVTNDVSRVVLARLPKALREECEQGNFEKVVNEIYKKLADVPNVRIMAVTSLHPIIEQKDIKAIEDGLTTREKIEAKQRVIYPHDYKDPNLAGTDCLFSYKGKSFKQYRTYGIGNQPDIDLRFNDAEQLIEDSATLEPAEPMQDDYLPFPTK